LRGKKRIMKKMREAFSASDAPLSKEKLRKINVKIIKNN
jgi:hypothetical protein